VIEKAGLRRFRIHDLRHTFASQSGASLAYVRDQFGHSSIQVTVDLYGHLVPSANIGWIDGLDPLQDGNDVQQSATQAQPETEEDEGAEAAGLEVTLPATRYWANLISISHCGIAGVKGSAC
jgi:integrase